MSGLLWTFFLFLVVQRLCELVIARRNEKWMKERGGLERGEEHYKYFVFLHLLFFPFNFDGSIFAEADCNPIPACLFYRFPAGTDS